MTLAAALPCLALVGAELAPPTAPWGMLACSPSDRKIVLTWTDRSTNKTGFRLERKTNAPNAQFVRIAELSATNYVDTTVTPGAIYTYHVRAFNAAGVSTFGEVTVKAGGAPPPPPAVPRIPAWNMPAKIVYSNAFPGFMDIEIYQENGRCYVRDKIKQADYKDPRPRRAYYVDMENIGPSLEQGYPLPERGGIYEIQCKRWREGKDMWDLQDAETAMEWVIKPGPLGVEGEMFIPPTFALDTDDWRDQQHKVIPPFEPILGKVSPSYRYNVDQTWEDILGHGASHTAHEAGPGGYEKTLRTVGDPLDALGEQGFAALSKEELTKYASQVPPLAFYFTDWEKQPGWHNTPTYWRIDLPDEKVLRNYYYFFTEMNRLQPARKNGDYYRAIKWNNSFYDEGEAYPLRPQFRLKQYESFLTMPRSVGEYSLDAGRTWVKAVGNERRDILEKAEKKQPLCFKWDAGGDLVMVFLAWPFADSPEWNVKLSIAPGQDRDVKMHRQWPMLRVFSKSDPNYGLPAPRPQTDGANGNKP